MNDESEVVLIQTAPCQGNPTGVVRLNKAEYDPLKHKLVTQEKVEDAAGGVSKQRRK